MCYLWNKNRVYDGHKGCRMTPSLLDNELVRKYFGCDIRGVQTLCDHFNQQNCHKSMSYRVLQAMQQPIRKGERYLVGTHKDSDIWRIVEKTWEGTEIKGWHTAYLRLPDVFQKQECEHSGLKRYCGKDVYCEECKREISNLFARCNLIIPHDGPCKPPPAPEKLTPLTCHLGHGFSSYCGLCDPHKPKDAVEEKIKGVGDWLYANAHKMKCSPKHIEYCLRDLVRLARETK